MSEIVKCENLQKSYRLGDTRLNVLKGVDMSVNAGEFVTVTGSSGSGKSTLLHILGALDMPDKGQVHFQGDNITRFSSRRLNKFRNRDVGFIFQFYHLIEEMNVLENVLMPVMAGFSALGWLGKKKAYQQTAVELIDSLGLSGRLKHRPSQLSGGERQRVAIGRALINKPMLLLADEPTGNLDWPTGQGILEILQKLHSNDGQTIIMVTHDRRVARMGDRQVVLEDGKVV
jgi:lipoprotein-releasing system ATP-binding protein